MPNIQPFKALVYSDSQKNHLSELISPPYDVISSEQFKALKDRNEFQSVRLCLAENPEDPSRYLKMKDLLTTWKSQKVLEYVTAPAFYLIEETYLDGPRETKRIGFVGLLETSPFSEGKVLPHEHTLSGPKKDRLELLQTIRTEMSQIFLCYKDPSLVVEKIYSEIQGTRPLLHCADAQGIKRKVWAISDVVKCNSIRKLIADKKVLIADGHHRYETALAYRDKSKFVQCYFTNLDTPGFSIRPIHRLFELPAAVSDGEFMNQLTQSFEVTPWTKPIDQTALMCEQSDTQLALICSLENGKKNYLLTQKKTSIKDAEIFAIHRDIFEKILHWDVSSLAKGTIQYEHETEDYLNHIKKMNRGVGLFLPPTDLQMVMALAEKGERMPQKSTFFYPKLASGLINFDLDQF